jgi:hypothetical protein
MKLPSWLWPIRTGKTFFDVWSICHFVAGMLIGFNVGSQGVELPIFIGINLALGYGWEVVERFIEKYAPHMVKHPEGPLNAWVSDPLMVLLGGLLGFWLVGLQ